MRGFAISACLRHNREDLDMDVGTREAKKLERLTLARIVLALAVMQAFTLAALAVLIAETSGYLCRF